MACGQESGDERVARGRRRGTWAALLVVTALLAGISGGPSAGAEPVGEPPFGPELAPGQIPKVCIEADGAAGASAYGSSTGFYWSELNDKWVAAPWCYPRWGFLAASPSKIVEAGDTVTVEALGDDSRLGPYIEAGWGSMIWTYPGTKVSGCGVHDMSCTVEMGEADPTGEWSWGQFHVTGPGRVFILPPSYAPRCQPDNPCLDTITNAWSWVGVRPSGVLPKADFTYTVDGGVVSFHATSVDPRGSVLFHEWAFGDGKSGTGWNPAHTYVRGGTYDVTLTSENEEGLFDSITKEVEVVGQPLSITNLAIDPPHPTISDEEVKVTVEITNLDDRPVTDVQPTVTSSNGDVLALLSPAVTPFDIPGQGTAEFDVFLEPGQAGETFIGVTATGTTPEGPTHAPAASLAVEVEGGELTSELDITSIVREGAGGTATIYATVVNASGADVESVDASLDAEPSTHVAISDPSGGSATLADGEGTVFGYNIEVDTTDPIEFQFDVEAVRATDGLVLNAPPLAVSIAFDGPLIDSVAAQRSGEATGTARGDERVIVTGTGLEDVTTADFEVGGYRYEATDLLVSSDNQLEFTTPNMVGQLEVAEGGFLLVDTELILTAATDQAPPDDTTESPAVPFRFEGPFIEHVEGPALGGVDGGTPVVSADGGETLTVVGTGFTDVTGASFEHGDTQALVDVTVESDTRLTLETPDGHTFLERFDSGGMSALADLTVHYLDEASVSDGVVSSNRAEVQVEGPSVTAVVGPPGDAKGNLRGGETVTVTGRYLGAITDAYFDPGDGPPQPALEVEVVDDTTVTLTTPDMTQFVDAEADGTMALSAELQLFFETDHESPHDVITTNRAPFLFEGPVVESLSDESHPATGDYSLTLTGRNLEHVTGVAFVVVGDDGPIPLVAPVLLAHADRVEVMTPDASEYLVPAEGGTSVVNVLLVAGYRDLSATGGQVTSNAVEFSFEGPAMTTTTKAATKGSTKVEVETSAGWSPGDYAQLGDDGPVRRVEAIGSLIFEAPLPIDVPAGTLVTKVSPPKGDEVAPTITISPDGGSFELGEPVPLAYECTDSTDGVGVEACEGSAPSGSALDTSTAGTFTVTVDGWDHNGNASTASMTYTVEDPTPGATTTPPAPAYGPTTAPAPGTLPVTGSPSAGPFAMLAAALLAGGVALVGMTDRRRMGRQP